MKKYFLIGLIILYTTASDVCTTFVINHNGQLAFGRNYDWVADAGLVCTNNRGLSKASYVGNDGSTISWISKYGSITFNQYGKEFPTGGMNEKGLVVELMWLDDTKYPNPDDRPALADLQWIQYQLDNCSSVGEVIASDKHIRIASGSTPLHYLVADANGNAATIEFLDGKMVAHHGQGLPHPVLTNDTYEKSLSAFHSKKTGGNNSLDRFITACDMVTSYVAGSSSLSAVDYSFSVLNRVSQGNFTKWQIVYDITNKKIYFRTDQAPEIKSLNAAALKFGCAELCKYLNINTISKGDLTTEFKILTTERHRELLRQSWSQSRSRIELSQAQAERVIKYSEKVQCF